MKVLYRDKDFIGIHKPSGIPVYSDQEAGAQDLLKEQVSRPVFPVHRLDKGTCGILMFAFRSEAASMLQDIFVRKNVEKIYLAVVIGDAPIDGKISEPLAGNKEKEKKPALSYFKKKGTFHFRLEDETPMVLSLLEVQPKTGRYHQIRRHLKHIGFPIVGDPDYGPIGLQKKIKRFLGTNRILLSSIYLSFRHPVNQKVVEIKTQPSDEMGSLIRKFQNRSG